MKKYPLLSLLLLVTLVMSPIQETFGQKRKKTPTLRYNQELYSSLQYRLIGPFRGGRSAAVTGVPGQENLYYMGTTGGGVWKSSDAGQHWDNISDGFFGGSIGAVSVAPSDHNVIYVGGGEGTVRGNVSSGYGVFKSIDAGKTWTHMGLANSRHIPRIRVNPTNADIVYAAVLGNIYKANDDRGVYKSTDGGRTWRKTLFANEQAGAVDLIIDPNNPRVLYASTWRIQRTPYSLSSGGEGSALWKSTDAGETWTEISSHKGFAQGTLGIIGVTVSPLNSDRIWAIVENKDQGGLYRSDDGGATWNLINSERKLRQRAWYYTKVYADTQELNTVYVMNVQYHKSTDGGKTFTAHNAPHGDHHDLWIAPENNQRMIIADDGGGQVSNDGGTTWSTYSNQPTAQFYRVTTDSSFPYKILAAQQDNSTVRINHRSDGYAITEDDWESTAGGESAHIAVDPLNNSIVYGGSYDGFLTRVNHDKGTVRGINVWPDNPMGAGAEAMKYRFQWNFPIMFSKHNPKALYTLSNHVHRSTNEGQHWELLSEDLTRNEPSKLKSSGGPITQDNTSVEYYGTLFAMDESPLKEGILWVGSDDGLVHLSKDNGKSWSNVTPKQLPTWAMVNSIDASHFDQGTAYIAATLYKEGDFRPYLYKTNDFGESWTTITSGIPPEHFTRVIRADHTRKGLLYAGTETGMYISFDDGASWNSFQLNLPIVPITDLTIKDNNLIVATQGRSLWIIDDLSVLHQLNTTDIDSAILYQPKDSYRTKGGGGTASNTAGTNHPNGVITHFYLPNDTSTVTLRFTNAIGDTLATFGTEEQEKNNKLTIKKGGNTLVWNTRGLGAEKLEGMILWWANLNGPKAVPGTYAVHLEVDGQSQKQSFKILADPRAESSIEDMQAQFDFITKVNTTINKAHESIKTIRATTKQLAAFQKQYKDDQAVSDLVEKAKAMADALSEVEKTLYQTQNRSGQDPLNFPIKLTNKLGHLNSLVGLDDFGPTEQDEEVRVMLTEQVEAALATFNTLLQEEVSSFNAEFNARGLNFLFVEE